MPIVKVFSSPPGAFTEGPYVAAAVMAVTLARASEPLKEPQPQRKRVKAEQTRPRNPNRLTVDQHVFPSRSIGRFAGEDGRVSVHDLHRGKVIRVKPDNVVFCARRAWDQRTEAGYMKRIEDDFQQAVEPLIEGKIAVASAESKPAIDRMYALWYMRSRFRELDDQEVQLKGILGGDLSKENEENLESNGYLFARKNGAMPARQLNAVVLRIRTDHYARDLADRITRWGVITAQSGELIVPDVPWHGILPLTPRLALVQSSLDGMITEQNLSQINTAFREKSLDYFFASDFSKCPFGPS